MENLEDFENLETNPETATTSPKGILMDSLEVGLQALSSTPIGLDSGAELNALPSELGEIGSAMLESGGHAIAHLAEGIGEAAGAIVEAIGGALGGL